MAYLGLAGGNSQRQLGPGSQDRMRITLRAINAETDGELPLIGRLIATDDPPRPYQPAGELVGMASAIL